MVAGLVRIRNARIRNDRRPSIAKHGGPPSSVQKSQKAMSDKGNGKKNGRWDAGVTPSAEMGYRVPDYQPKDSTDVLAAFHVTPQPGVEGSSRARRRWRVSPQPPPGAWCGPTG